jgi:NADPH-dependent curcumin reductase CurA
MTDLMSREIRLAHRPVGVPDESTFDMVEVSVPPPGPGEVLVRNLFMSVDPYMRSRMIDRKSYVPPFEVGKTLQGGAVGEVVASRHDDFAAGDSVLSMFGWREHFVADGRHLRKVDEGAAPLSTYLGVIGMPGLTAYVGLLDIGRPKSSETVFVSGAAGAVGSVACQIAKLKGCRVVGSAGSPEKVEWLKSEAGIDAALNYREVDDLRAALAETCPEGIDIYFDNVGGAHLEAALWTLNDFGRIVACGSISLYNAAEATPGPRNLFFVVTKRLRFEGFIVSDHGDRQQDFLGDMAGWITSGEVRWRETIYEGIEEAPAAFLGLFTGANLGKMVVRLS